MTRLTPEQAKGDTKVMLWIYGLGIGFMVIDWLDLGWVLEYGLYAVIVLVPVVLIALLATCDGGPTEK